MNITVRRAATTDIAWLLGELKKFSSLIGTKIPMLPEGEQAKSILSYLVDTHVVLVAEKAGERLGFICGVITPHFLNPTIRVLAETFWWVAEEHRGSRAALLLFNAFVEHGKFHADWITMALEALSPVNESCLTKRGFKLQERAFLMEVAS
jgi:hypothetical protein